MGIAEGGDKLTELKNEMTLNHGGSRSADITVTITNIVCDGFNRPTQVESNGRIRMISPLDAEQEQL